MAGTSQTARLSVRTKFALLIAAVVSLLLTAVLVGVWLQSRNEVVKIIATDLGERKKAYAALGQNFARYHAHIAAMLAVKIAPLIKQSDKEQRCLFLSSVIDSGATDTNDGPHPDYAALQGPNGNVLAIAVRGRPVCDPQLERWRLPDVHTVKRKMPLLTGWADPDGQIYAVHTASITDGASGEPLGTISIGFHLDDHSAAVAKARVGTDVVFWREEERQSKLEPVLLGTSEPRLRPALMEAISARQPEVRFKSGKEEWLLADVVPQTSGLIIDNPERIHFGLLQSITNVRKSFQALETYLAILAVCALAGGIYVSFNFSRPIVAELNQRQQMLKFLSHTTVDSLEHRGGERRWIVAMFSDIRGFTSFCDGRDPASVVERLNQVLGIQAEIVAKHGGDIDKFIGDAMFAWFSGDDRCQRAVAAAREMLAALERQFGACAGAQVGIGIHVGEVIAGALGSQDRLDYTAIGSTVNLAERLCSVAHAGQILMSQPVAMELGNSVPLRALDPIHVKGFADEIVVYEVIPDVGAVSAVAGAGDVPHTSAT